MGLCSFLLVYWLSVMVLLRVYMTPLPRHDLCLMFFWWPRLTEEALARDGSDSAGPGGPVHINALRIIETSL